MYDTILMDIQMPGMDGVEVAKLVRARLLDDLQPQIIAATTTAFESNRDYYLSQGLDDYISKPIALDALSTAIERQRVRNGQSPLPPVSPAPAEASAKTTMSAAQPDGLMPPNVGFDAGMLAQLHAVAGDEGDSLVHEVVNIFLTNTPPQLAEMQQLAAHGELATLARTAHQLKSSSASIGVTGLATLCAEIERRGRAGNPEGLTELIRRGADEFRQVQPILMQF